MPTVILHGRWYETVTVNSLVSLRHCDAEGMCLCDPGVVVAGERGEAALRERIGDPRLACVNIHTARPGCRLARNVPRRG
jgi:hypothetical protein